MGEKKTGLREDILVYEEGFGTDGAMREQHSRKVPEKENGDWKSNKPKSGPVKD